MSKITHLWGGLDVPITDTRLNLISHYLIVSGTQYEAVEENFDRVKVVRHDFEGWFNSDKLLEALKPAHGNSVETDEIIRNNIDVRDECI